MPDSLPTIAALRARRAIGAMFYAAFGGAWLALWSFRALAYRGPALVLVALGSLALLGLAYRRYRNHRGALAVLATPAQQRADRLFHLINGGQWVVILVVGNILANVGLGAWVLPMVIFVVGLHFLPLAVLFANSPHYATGGALMLLALGYPFLAPGGPGHPVGCLGAGLILWASALWAVLDHPAAGIPA